MQEKGNTNLHTRSKNMSYMITEHAGIRQISFEKMKKIQKIAVT